MPPRYKPVGKCIYCGATVYCPEGGKLTKEHIIPLGLGGKHILPEASCYRCQEQINREIETPVLQNGVLGAARFIMKAPSRAKKRGRKQRDNFPVFTPDGDRIDVPAEDYPGFLMLPLLGIPGLFLGWNEFACVIELNMPWPLGFWLRRIEGYGFNPGLKKHTAAEKFSIPKALDHGAFTRFLAKIAHAFTVAEVGIDGFTPLLLPHIRGERARHIHYLVGGHNKDDRPPVNSAYCIHLVRQPLNGKVYLLVEIRFFAWAGGPMYWVVSGERPP